MAPLPAEKSTGRAALATLIAVLLTLLPLNASHNPCWQNSSGMSSEGRELIQHIVSLPEERGEVRGEEKGEEKGVRPDSTAVKPTGPKVGLALSDGVTPDSTAVKPTRPKVGVALSAGVTPDSTEVKPSRPKVGLALSGGGAKGIAHVGFIRVLEEAGLTPDYITGVSMGSIVGGMYAMGYSPDSMAQMFKAFDWSAAMSDMIPENKVIFLEKKNYHNSLISLPVTRRAIKIPSGLISGQQIESSLNHYFWPAATISNFDSLPIPFLCLATDVVTSSSVIFRSGYLPDAIRASIAIPTVFTPVRSDTAILVDGGVVRNYAATELREMGADIVIGSYVSFRGYKGDDLQSAYEIMKQIGMITSITDYEEQKKETDIMIEPRLTGVGTLSFNLVDSIIAEGYREALKYSDLFRQLADSLDAIGPRKPVERLPDLSHYTFDAVRIKGNRLITAEQIRGMLEIGPGDRVDRSHLEERIELLYGKGWFEKIKYRIIPEEERLILEIECIERPRAMLYGSLHYDQTLSAGAVIRLTVRDLLTTSSVMSADAYIGEYYRFRVSATQFIDKSQKSSLEVSFFTDNTQLPLIRLGHETGPMLSRNLTTRVALSKRVSLNHLTSMAIALEKRYLSPDFITATNIRRFSYDYLNLGVTYETNTLDRKHFPGQGIVSGVALSTESLLKATVRTRISRTVHLPGDLTSPFVFNRNYIARAWFNSYFSPGTKVTLNLGGDLLYSTGADSITTGNDFWYLGGMEALTGRSIAATGFHPNQIAVRKALGARSGIDIGIAPDLHLTLDLNLFAINEPERKTGYSLLGGYGIGAGYMTIAGPIQIGLMHGFYKRQILYKGVKGYVMVGFTF